MLIQELTAHVTEKILPFWEKLIDRERGGFYGFVDENLVIDPRAHKGCILNSRILWAFSTAARVLEDASYLRYADQALDFMARFEDTARGGVYWSVTAEGQPLDTTKHTYCQAFALYGLAAYLRAADKNTPRWQTARARAARLFRVIEGPCSDAGGLGEAFNADFTPAGNERLSDNARLEAKGETAQRTMNTLLHVLEAYAELQRACPDEAVRAAGKRCLETALKKVYSPEKARLEVFFDKDYRSLLDMQSFGHDIEASWLMWDAAETLLSPEELPPYRAMCLSLAKAVCERALTPHGLNNERVEDEVDDTCVWWVQAETVLGCENAYALTGDASYHRNAEAVWAVIRRTLVDERPHGEWHAYARADGTVLDRPVVDDWKCPYHNGRMCLRLIEKAKG